MPWIPHFMVVDDDASILDAIINGAADLEKRIEGSPSLGPLLRRNEPSNYALRFSLKVSTHGFESRNLDKYQFRYRTPYHAHLHLVCERGGRFDEARHLLNTQPFAVVLSDLVFSARGGEKREGLRFVDEIKRIYPHIECLHFSAFGRPGGVSGDHFISKKEVGSGPGSRFEVEHRTLFDLMVRAAERHAANPAVAAFAAAVADEGVVYQSECFGSSLADVFNEAQLLGFDASRGDGRRRPLPSLLIDGESGTGKRALASLFHQASDRRGSPYVVVSCNELTNETLLRSILFGHRRGAFTDARDDRPGMVSQAGSGVLVLDDLHHLPVACTAILHSFLEDGEYSRLGEEEVRRRTEAAVVMTVESGPWREKRRSGGLSSAFLARVERLPLYVTPLRERPDDIEAQARWHAQACAAHLRGSIELDDDAVALLRDQPFAESNSRELRTVIERAVRDYYKEKDVLGAVEVRQYLLADDPRPRPSPGTTSVLPSPEGDPTNLTVFKLSRDGWYLRMEELAAKFLGKGLKISKEEARKSVDPLFNNVLPALWGPTERGRELGPEGPTVPLSTWCNIWRCFAVVWLGTPAEAERVLGLRSGTLRAWICFHESPRGTDPDD